MQVDKLSIKPGDVFILERTFTEEDVRAFTRLSGDEGVHHLEAARPMLQGLLTASLVTEFGGSIDYLASEMIFRFHRPAFAGDTIHCEGRCTDMRDEEGRRFYAFSFSLTNQKGKEVISGTVQGVVLK